MGESEGRPSVAIGKMGGLYAAVFGPYAILEVVSPRWAVMWSASDKRSCESAERCLVVAVSAHSLMALRPVEPRSRPTECVRSIIESQILDEVSMLFSGGGFGTLSRSLFVVTRHVAAHSSPADAETLKTGEIFSCGAWSDESRSIKRASLPAAAAAASISRRARWRG